MILPVASTMATRLMFSCLSPTAVTFDGDSVLEACQRRADLMVRTLQRAMP